MLRTEIVRSGLQLLCLLVAAQLVLAARSSSSATQPTCSNYTVCSTCPNSSQIPYVATLIPLGTSQPFAANMDKAELIMNATTGVQQLDFSSQLHVSVNYFCCLFPEQVTLLGKVLASVSWSPFNIIFDKAECNTNGDPWNLGGISFIVWLDTLSMLRMANLSHVVERAVVAAGLPVYRPRALQEPYHSTLGTVNLDYPCQQVLTHVASAVPNFSPSPVGVDLFVLPASAYNPLTLYPANAPQAAQPSYNLYEAAEGKEL